MLLLSFDTSPIVRPRSDSIAHILWMSVEGLNIGEGEWSSWPWFDFWSTSSCSNLELYGIYKINCIITKRENKLILIMMMKNFWGVQFARKSVWDVNSLYFGEHIYGMFILFLSVLKNINYITIIWYFIFKNYITFIFISWLNHYQIPFEVVKSIFALANTGDGLVNCILLVHFSLYILQPNSQFIVLVCYSLFMFFECVSGLKLLIEPIERVKLYFDYFMWRLFIFISIII